MSDKPDDVNPRDRVARAAAKGWLQEHPVADVYRQFILYVIAEYLDEHCTFFVGVRELAHRTGMSKPKAQQVINELIENGIVVVLNPERPRNGRRVCRLDYEKCADVYPLHVLDSSGKRSKVGNRVTHSPAPTVGNIVTHSNGAANPKVGNGAGQKWVTESEFVGNAVTPSIEQVNKSSSNRPVAAHAPCAVTASTSPPTLAVPTRASDEHVQQQRVLQRAAKQATVDELVSQFRRLCDKGACTWTENKVQHGTMLRRFADLIRERIVTVDTMRKALPIAQKRVGKRGRPSGAAIVAAMFAIAKQRPVEPMPAEDKSFFDRPAAEAGTFNAPGNFTLH